MTMRIINQLKLVEVNEHYGHSCFAAHGLGKCLAQTISKEGAVLMSVMLMPRNFFGG